MLTKRHAHNRRRICNDIEWQVFINHHYAFSILSVHYHSSFAITFTFFSDINSPAKVNAVPNADI